MLIIQRITAPSDLANPLSTCRDVVFFSFCDSRRAEEASGRAAAIVAAAAGEDDDDDDDDVTEHDEDSLLQTRTQAEMTARRALWRASRPLINAGNDFKASSRDSATATTPAGNKASDPTRR